MTSPTLHKKQKKKATNKVTREDGKLPYCVMMMGGTASQDGNLAQLS